MNNLGGYLLAEVMLWLMYAAVAIALVLVVISAVRSWSFRYESISASNRVPRKKIAWGVVNCSAILVMTTCLTGSSEPLIINGISYTNRFWLKVTDGLISSSLVLMFIAACFVVFGLSGINRKVKL